MELFSNFQRVDSNFKYPLETDFNFYNRVKNTEYEKIRNLLNEWFNQYPKENQNRLISNFKNNFYSSFYELFVFNLLRKFGLVLKIESIDKNTNKTPDFLCKLNDVSFYVECTIATGISEEEKKIENIKNSLYSKLSELNIPEFFLNIQKFELKVKKTPKTSLILRVIQNKIDELINNGITSIKSYQSENSNRVRYEDDIVSLEVSFIPKRSEYYGNISHPIGMYPATASFVGIEDSIPRSIKKKIDKYNNLTNNYIIFINNTESIHYNKDELIWHLYGNSTWLYNTNKKPLFGSSKTNNLMAVIVTNVFPENINRFSVDLYLNSRFEKDNDIIKVYVPNLEKGKHTYNIENVHNLVGVSEDFLSYIIWNF